MSEELHKEWKRVWGDTVCENLLRMRVPGGWIYLHADEPNIEPTTKSITFVPYPPQMHLPLKRDNTDHEIL